MQVWLEVSMDKLAKFLLNGKVLLALLFSMAVVVCAAPTLFRRVKAYQPPADRDLSGWGTMNPEAATSLQAALDAEVNRQGVPGFQGAIRTTDGQTWYGVSGTTDPE